MWRDIRFSPESDQIAALRKPSLRANFDQSAPQQKTPLFDYLVGKLENA